MSRLPRLVGRGIGRPRPPPRPSPRLALAALRTRVTVVASSRGRTTSLEPASSGACSLRQTQRGPSAPQPPGRASATRPHPPQQNLRGTQPQRPSVPGRRSARVYSTLPATTRSRQLSPHRPSFRSFTRPVPPTHRVADAQVPRWLAQRLRLHRRSRARHRPPPRKTRVHPHSALTRRAPAAAATSPAGGRLAATAPQPHSALAEGVVPSRWRGPALPHRRTFRRGSELKADGERTRHSTPRARSGTGSSPRRSRARHRPPPHCAPPSRMDPAWPALPAAARLLPRLPATLAPTRTTSLVWPIRPRRAPPPQPPPPPPVPRVAPRDRRPTESTGGQLRQPCRRGKAGSLSSAARSPAPRRRVRRTSARPLRPTPPAASARHCRHPGVSGPTSARSDSSMRQRRQHGQRRQHRQRQRHRPLRGGPAAATAPPTGEATPRLRPSCADLRARRSACFARRVRPPLATASATTSAVTETLRERPPGQSSTRGGCSPPKRRGGCSTGQFSRCSTPQAAVWTTSTVASGPFPPTPSPGRCALAGPSAADC
mmetsp:Transcript_5885/g.24788  ORF Transcript_5885/g.24788 Transcript_5885/m.24788 type:complete len:544 (-) Transcript_5885:532-2163(-)